MKVKWHKPTRNLAMSLHFTHFVPILKCVKLQFFSPFFILLTYPHSCLFSDLNSVLLGKLLFKHYINKPRVICLLIPCYVCSDHQNSFDNSELRKNKYVQRKAVSRNFLQSYSCVVNDVIVKLLDVNSGLIKLFILSWNRLQKW